MENSRKGPQDNITLENAKFEIGDYLSVAVIDNESTATEPKESIMQVEIAAREHEDASSSLAAAVSEAAKDESDADV